MSRGHRHIILVDGKAKKAQEYPKELCDAIIDGYLLIKEQWKERCLDKEVNSLDFTDPNDNTDAKYFDDLTHENLPTKLVTKARSEEMTFFAKRAVYEYVCPWGGHGR